MFSKSLCANCATQILIAALERLTSAYIFGHSTGVCCLLKYQNLNLIPHCLQSIIMASQVKISWCFFFTDKDFHPLPSNAHWLFLWILQLSGIRGNVWLNCNWFSYHKYQNFQTGSGVHPAPDLMGIRILSQGIKWPLTSSYCWG